MALTDQLDSRVNRAGRKREAFLTAFFNQLTTGIKERGEEAKEEKKFQRTRALASKQDYDARVQKINTLKDLTQKLVTLGADKNDLMFYIKDKNPVEALQSVYTEVSGLVTKANKLPNFDITKSMIKDILNVPADFKPPEMSMKEFWERTVNVFTEHESNFPSENAESFLGNLFYGAMNINANARVMKELESQIYTGNKSIMEINEIAQRSAYADPFQGRFVDRAAMDLSQAPPIYSPTDVERFEEDYKTLVSTFFDKSAHPQIIEDKFGISLSDQALSGSEDIGGTTNPVGIEKSEVSQLGTRLSQAISDGKDLRQENKDLLKKYLAYKNDPRNYITPLKAAQNYAVEKSVAEFQKQKGITDPKIFDQVIPQLPFLNQFLLKSVN